MKDDDQVHSDSPEDFAKYLAWSETWPSWRDTVDEVEKPFVEAMKELQPLYLVTSRGEGDYKVGDNVNVYILGEPEDTTYSSLEEIPSLEDQIRDMQPEDDVFYSKDMLEGYEMAKADVLAIIELWNEEW